MNALANHDRATLYKYMRQGLRDHAIFGGPVPLLAACEAWLALERMDDRDYERPASMGRGPTPATAQYLEGLEE